MSSKLYIMYGCPVCAEAELGVIQINSTLPIGNKIQIIHINSNRPELALMAKIFKSSNPADWQVPLLLLEERGINRTFDSYVPTNQKHRAKAISVFHREHLFAYIEEYLKGEW